MSDREHTPAIFVVSLGCAKNLVDTEVICGGLAVDGYLLTDQLELADIIMINTCSFIADARDEADAEIRAAIKWKREASGRRVVVGGCLPQRDLKAVREAYPQVDLFLGLDDVSQVGRRLRELDIVNGEAGTKQNKQNGSERFDEAEYIYDHATPRLLLTPVNYAYVKIAEGCNHFCRFCAIPAIRGRLRSRSVNSIIVEIERLLDQGVKEINLIAQDTTAYGLDREDEASLAGLLRAASAIAGDFWLRVLYTHPAHFSDEVLDAMAADSRIVPYIDMPLQHISGKILKAMGRRTPPDTIKHLLAQIRGRLPGAVLRTTFLVGYPGEAQADYKELRDFVKAMRFERLGVFAYSSESGTAAARITAGLVPAEEAEERRAELLTIQQGISLARNRELIGSVVQTLVEEIDEAGNALGRSRADAPDVDNRVNFTATDRDPVDKGFVDVRITEAGPYDLFGRQITD